MLELVHSDICGPMNTESLGGAKYFVTFTDDCTRYTETTMLRNKSDVFEAFKNYKKKAEKQTGKQIKKLRTDNGKEYLSNNFKNFLKEEGISHQLSVEYTPQQNGVAERKNRTLVEMARCIMLQGNLPQSLWAEAVNAATYIRNRCTTKTSEKRLLKRGRTANLMLVSSKSSDRERLYWIRRENEESSNQKVMNIF